MKTQKKETLPLPLPHRVLEIPRDLVESPGGSTSLLEDFQFCVLGFIENGQTDVIFILGSGGGLQFQNKKIIDFSINVFPLDAWEERALHMAVKRGQERMVKLLLTPQLNQPLKQNLEQTTGGAEQQPTTSICVRIAEDVFSTSLRQATKNNHLGIMKVLLEDCPECVKPANYHVDSTASTLGSRTALHEATSLEAVTLLCKHGASPLATNSAQDTPLHKLLQRYFVNLSYFVNIKQLFA